ncbi:glucosyltransferase domain-containing protein [Planomicrobium sp. Y74]|uniref:glucosyltransferase domain-containing protein n=1 Tax=Planomicrobium sp. Y74 TaxID=2478977 RepID=UPI000EF524C6|nr:glucosyltransferase domain-containing protein [Planomicrobium sp. Y74]RLQ86682.1 hypothetical protein D9754_14755 [Planomicrobium sp. Y74]
MPEELIRKWLTKIKREWKTAFLAAAIFGLLTHLYIFTNYMPHHDGILSIYTPQQGFEMGRFFLTPFSGIGSYFDLPWLNGMLSVFYLTLTTVALTDLFRLQKTLSIILTAGLLTTFPVITATLSYTFTADGYMAASFVTLLALLLASKYKYGFVPGAFLLYMGVSVYQANFPFLLTVATVFLINEILSFGISLRKVLSYIARFGLLALIGMGLYYLTFKIYTDVFSGELLEYQGVDEVGNSSAGLLEIVPLIRSGMVEYFFRGIPADMPANLFEVLNVLLFILIVLAIAAAVVENRIYESGWKLAVVMVLLFSLPFSAYSLFFISPDIWYHFLMILAVIGFYLLPVVIYDKLKISSILSKVTSWSTVLLFAVIIFNFAIIANISYLNMELKFEKSQALALRILDRMEQTEGFDKDTPIAVYGSVPIESEISTLVRQKIPPLTGPLQKILLQDARHFQSMMDNFFGVPYEFILDEEDLHEIVQSADYEEMEAWPAESSVQMSDGVLIIKLEE